MSIGRVEYAILSILANMPGDRWMAPYEVSRRAREDGVTFVHMRESFHACLPILADRMGWVEKRERGKSGGRLPTYEYRITEEGRAVLRGCTNPFPIGQT